MIIKNIELKKFKFHHNLDFKIDKQNCLIYGENGSGKSSIYWALYSLFKCYFRNNQFDFSKFQNKNSEENLSVKILLDDMTLSIPHENYLLPTEISINNHKSIYFANQDLLNEITNEDNNFYNTILRYLKKYFATLESFDKAYNLINETIEGTNVHEKNDEKELLDSQYKKYIEDDLTPLVNDVLLNHLKENYQINLEFQSGILDTGNFRFPNPKIILTIDNQSNLKLHFNEAKLKLTSIAIFFALIKLENNKNNSLKLLVLDDFLTSLDMANRHYIIEYIFSNFEDYQIILLTHNLQFYNLILDWLNTHKKESEWDIKNIYVRNNKGEKESVIYNHNANYIEEAKKKLNGNNDELQVCGNLIRKEFERIIHELEKFYKLGKKEETDTIISLIMNDKPIYLNQNTLFKKISSDINHCENMSNNMENNTERVKNKLTNISEKLKKDTSTSNQHLKAILENLIFYRKILLNKASHDNPNAEVYRKEYKDSIVVIEELNKLLSELK